MKTADRNIREKNYIVRTFETIKNIGTSEIKDEALAANVMMTNTLSFTFGALLLILAPVVILLTQKASVFIALSVEFIVNALVLVLNHHRRHTLASLVLYFLQTIVIIYFGILFGKQVQLLFMLTFLIFINYLIFSNRWIRWIGFLFALATLCLLRIAYAAEWFTPIPLTHTIAGIIETLIIVVVLVVAIVCVSKPYEENIRNNLVLKRANEFKRIFVSQVTHEIRTPLSSIYAIAQLLKKECKQNPHLNEAESLINQQLVACNNARIIINNVLDFALIESGHMETPDEENIILQEFMEKVIAVNKVIAHTRNINLQLSIEHMPEIIKTDPLKLSQILTNLLVNAIKYGEKESTVTVSILGSFDHWLIQVSNQGPDIPPEKQQAIFEPYVTDKGKYVEGTGLGLSIVKSKVETLSGQVSVESRDHLTTFTVILPLEEGRLQDVVREETPASNTAVLNGLHILLAEDNELYAKLVARFLRKIGCLVTIAANGAEAIRQMTIRTPDIILMDAQMPEMDGLEALTHIRASSQYQHIPVIIASANTFTNAQDAFMNAGADAFIEKPVNFAELQQLLHRYASQDISPTARNVR
ncbi:response regulator [Chitinophaga pendula]|uniref:ATP-binding response regulator n=1 Tax=Chitinophaga TaxID=79328 RepID=UPI0018DFD657|nr:MULTISPECIES: response regulator [Chitinophaga]UCJ10162.1 response regulator [Chitinophaga pendula]